jgi:hypothetical protein
MEKEGKTKIVKEMPSLNLTFIIKSAPWYLLDVFGFSKNKEGLDSFIIDDEIEWYGRSFISQLNKVNFFSHSPTGLFLNTNSNILVLKLLEKQ